MKIIGVFNHKGGVSKTTMVFHLAWMLANLGKRVMAVDCDPQCNLTGLFLGEIEVDEYPFESNIPRKPQNIRDAVRPAFESRPYPIAPTELYESPKRSGLYLLPGHVGLSELESALAVSHELSNTLPAFQNIPGALHYAISKTGATNNIDFALIDMSPSLGAINQNLLMTSDYFFIPMAPDIFSTMALQSLAATLPKWAEWGKKAAQNSILRTADYPFPDVSPKYLGSSVQNFRKRARDGEESQPTQSFRQWFDKLSETREAQLVPALGAANLLLPDEVYRQADAPTDRFLMEIGSLDGLIATAQQLGKPVFAIDIDSDTSWGGIVAENYQKKIDDVEQRIRSGAQKIIALTESN